MKLDIDRDFKEFIAACESQRRGGGKRYALEENKEFTDLICEVVGNQWIGGNIMKYSGEIENELKLGYLKGKVQEVNFFKLAVYCFIWWLKEFKHPTTGIKLKEENWDEFVSGFWKEVSLWHEPQYQMRITSTDFILMVKEFIVTKEEGVFFEIAATAFWWWYANRDKFTDRDIGEEFKK